MRFPRVLALCLLVWCTSVQAADPPRAATTSEPAPQPTSPVETPVPPGPAQAVPAPAAPPTDAAAAPLAAHSIVLATICGRGRFGIRDCAYG